MKVFRIISEGNVWRCSITTMYKHSKYCYLEITTVWELDSLCVDTNKENFLLHWGVSSVIREEWNFVIFIEKIVPSKSWYFSTKIVMSITNRHWHLPCRRMFYCLNLLMTQWTTKIYTITWFEDGEWERTIKHFLAKHSPFYFCISLSLCWTGLSQLPQNISEMTENIKSICRLIQTSSRTRFTSWSKSRRSTVSCKKVCNGTYMPFPPNIPDTKWN